MACCGQIREGVSHEEVRECLLGQSEWLAALRPRGEGDDSPSVHRREQRFSQSRSHDREHHLRRTRESEWSLDSQKLRDDPQRARQRVWTRSPLLGDAHDNAAGSSLTRLPSVR